MAADSPVRALGLGVKNYAGPWMSSSVSASSSAVSRRMARTLGKDNPRERELRSALHRQGLRFRIHYPGIPGTRRSIDIAFTTLRLAVFCDGCYWHGCPIHATVPKVNREWWKDKIAANKARDLDTDTRLANDRWEVLRIWEHVPIDDAVALVLSRLQQISSSGPAHVRLASER